MHQTINQTTAQFQYAQAAKDAVGKLQDQANQVGRSANAAEKAVVNTQEQLRLDQRAWIGLLNIDAGNFSKTNGFPIVITFSNSGRTPAKHVTISQEMMIAYRPLSGPPDSEIKKLIQQPAIDIAPQGKLARGTTQTTMPSVPLNNDQMQFNNTVISYYDAINEGKLLLYYFGKITYQDIFGIPHNTNYCVVLLDPKSKAIGFCDEFNDIQ